MNRTDDDGEGREALEALHQAALGMLESLPTELQERIASLQERDELRLVVAVRAPIAVTLWSDSAVLARWDMTRPVAPVIEAFLEVVAQCLSSGLRRLARRDASAVAAALASATWRGQFSYELAPAPAARFELVAAGEAGVRTLDVFELHAAAGGVQH